MTTIYREEAIKNANKLVSVVCTGVDFGNRSDFMRQMNGFLNKLSVLERAVFFTKYCRDSDRSRSNLINFSSVDYPTVFDMESLDIAHGFERFDEIGMLDDIKDYMSESKQSSDYDTNLFDYLIYGKNPSRIVNALGCESHPSGFKLVNGSTCKYELKIHPLEDETVFENHKYQPAFRNNHESMSDSPPTGYDSEYIGTTGRYTMNHAIFCIYQEINPDLVYHFQRKYIFPRHLSIPIENYLDLIKTTPSETENVYKYTLSIHEELKNRLLYFQLEEASIISFKKVLQGFKLDPENYDLYVVNETESNLRLELDELFKTQESCLSHRLVDNYNAFKSHTDRQPGLFFDPTYEYTHTKDLTHVFSYGNHLLELDQARIAFRVFFDNEYWKYLMYESAKNTEYRKQCASKKK